MQEDNKGHKNRLSNLSDTLDNMMYGYEDPKTFRFNELLKRRRLKKQNPAK